MTGVNLLNFLFLFLFSVTAFASGRPECIQDVFNELVRTSGHEMPMVSPLNLETNHARLVMRKWDKLEGNSDRDIRIWYTAQVSKDRMIDLNNKWIVEGISLKERARRLYLIRHNSRLIARNFMADKTQVERLRERDFKRYGDHDGPTFEFLIEEARKRDLSPEEAYTEIISSTSKTNPRTNSFFNLSDE